MAPVLTKQLQAYRVQMDRAFPNRDRKSDGWIGNLAHQSGASGHNPDRTGTPEWRDGDSKDEVRAIDVDADTGNPAVSMEDVVQHLLRLARSGRLRFIRYMIFNRRIWSAGSGWVEKPYGGSSPHTEHLHLSGAYDQSSDELASADYHLDELLGDDMSWTDDVITNPTWRADAKINPTVQAKFALGDAWNQAHAANVKADKILALLQVISGKDFTDEAAIVKGVLVGLPASAIAEAIPDQVAQEIVDLLAARMAA